MIMTFIPVRYEYQIPGPLTFIDESVTLSYKFIFFPVCPNTRGSSDALVEVGVNGRTSNCLDAFQLPGSRDIQTLKNNSFYD